MQKTTKDKTYRSAFIAASLIIVAIIVGATLLYIRATNNNMDQAVNTLSSFYMEELLGKREVVLKDALNRDFELLGRVVALIGTKEIQDQASLRKVLLFSQTLYGAKKLAMVDEDNTIYTAHSTFSDASRYAFLQKDFTEPRIVTSNLYGAKKQVVLAIPVEGIRVLGKRIIACFIQLDIDDVAGSLTSDNVNSSGKVFIGLYYKNGENLTTSKFDEIDSKQNLIKFIQKALLLAGQDSSKIGTSFHKGEKGLVTIKSADDIKYIYYSPVENTDWMLTVMVHDNTIADQLGNISRRILQRNVFQLISTMVFLIAMFLLIGSLYKRNGDIRRRHQELQIKARNEREQKMRLEEIATMAKAANMAKTNFLNSMSHDIRTPMNAIIGYTAMAKRYSDNSKVEDYLGKIDVSGRQLLSLVNQVLEMSRIESGKIVLSEEPADLVEKANAVRTIIAADCNMKNISFTIDTSGIVHKDVIQDVSRVNQIISNILGNAVKYTPEGGSISCTAVEKPWDKEGYGLYEIMVKDTGIGMSDEFLKHIFEEFSREKTSTISRIQGTGLGMSIVKKLVDLMGGDIDIQSTPGQGTVVTVSIPMKWDDVSRRRETEAQNLEAVDFRGKRLLLVEDNEMNREIASDILMESGFVVETAEDGLIAVEKVSNSVDSGKPGYYDVILMDIQMPRMNGFEATQAIRAILVAQDVHVPIIALSANAFEEDRQKSLEAGMDDHVAKPIDVQKLKETLAKYLRH